MLGDVYHEGIIFHLNILEDDYSFFHSTLSQFIQDEKTVNGILELYDIFPNTPHDVLLGRFEHMAGDAIFKILNFITAILSSDLQQKESLFTYHFDQRSRLKNPLEGTAYHAHELLYLFLNLTNKMNEAEILMAHRFAEAWISFVYGEKPWKAEKEQWMVWGQDSKFGVVSEGQDEKIRGYVRMKKIVEMAGGEVWKKWLLGIDAIVNKRMRLGTMIVSQAH